MADRISSRLRNAWNAFVYDEKYVQQYSAGVTISTSRPDRVRLQPGSEKSIINSIYNRIANDVSSCDIKHVKLDANGRFVEVKEGPLNDCLTLSANIDQTGRALLQDLVVSMMDEGVVAVVPVETDYDPNDTEGLQIYTLRIGKIKQWEPTHVRVELYDERDGVKKEIRVAKAYTAIIENPFYSVMNEKSSTMQRLIRKLNLLDAIDDKIGSSKLDLIIQLPYSLKSPERLKQAQERKKVLEDQLENSKSGIAYIDSTEHVTQLNRSVDNNLMSQIEYLTRMLYSQLGLSESVMDGTADEQVMLNYQNRIIEPILSTIVDEMTRKFLSKTARSQKQAIAYFKDPFKLVPVAQIAEIADKFTRNEILSSNEIRVLVGFKPVDDPSADELRNKNLNQSNEQLGEQGLSFPSTRDEEEEI